MNKKIILLLFFKKDFRICAHSSYKNKKAYLNYLYKNPAKKKPKKKKETNNKNKKYKITTL